MLTHYLYPLLIFLVVMTNIGYTQTNFTTYSIQALDSLYERELDASNYEQALVIAKVNLKKVEEKVGKNDTTYAKKLIDVAYANESLKKLDQAIANYTKAIAIFEQKSPLHHQLYVASYYLTTIHEHQGDFEKAIKRSKKLIVYWEEKAGTSAPNYAGSLINVGALYRKIGAFEEAQRSYLKALSVFKKQQLLEHPFYAIGLRNLGNLNSQIGDFRAAEVYYQQALEIEAKIHGKQTTAYASVLMSFGLLHGKQKEYKKADIYYTQALQLTEAAENPNPYLYQDLLNNVGLLYKNIKKFDKAQQRLEKALAHSKRLYGSKHPKVAGIWNNLALLYTDMEAYEKAKDSYLKSQTIYKQVLGEQHPRYISTFTNLGNLYRHRNDWIKATQHFEKAIALFENAGLHKNTFYFNTLVLACATYAERQKEKEVLKMVQKHIANNTTYQQGDQINENWKKELSEATYFSKISMLDILDGLYLYLTQKKLISQQGLVADLAIKLTLEIKNDFSEEGDQLNILKQNAIWVRRRLETLDSNKEANKAFEIAEQNKSILLLDAIKELQTRNKGILPHALVQKEKQLKKDYSTTKAALEQAHSTAKKDSLQARLTQLSIKLGQQDENIQKNYPEYAKFEQKTALIEATSIQNQLAKQSALIEYVVDDSLLHVIYIDQQKTHWIKLPLNASTLSQKIKDYHDILSNYSEVVKNKNRAYQKYNSLAYWFYEHLIAPLPINESTITQLIIIPDGELGHLPFGTFLMERGNQSTVDFNQLHYLIKDYSISYNYSATLWHQNSAKKQHPHNGKMLAMAATYAPSMDVSLVRSPAHSQLRKVLQPIPGALEETQSLSNIFDGFFAVDSLATERLFKEKAKDFGIIHLAMHGILDKHAPALSTLAFTENLDSLEDNFLYAHEISNMELQAELVVLSACETGYGKFEQGNGIASLARSFMYAGTPALIVSLWQVNDAATANIMQELYNNIKNGMRKDVALQKAKLTYIQKAKGVAAHPAYWSPFIQIGKTQAIHIKEKGGYWPWLIGGGLVVLFLMGGFALSRRKKETA